MTASAPTVLATSIGFDSRGRGPYDWSPGPVFDLAVDLAGSPARPRICHLATATGDDPARVGAFYAAFAGRDVEVSHLSLFPMPTVADVRAHLRAQDVVWVGGGSVVNLLAVWRAHGLDEVFAEAWRAGVVLGGVSAGAICWHTGGSTDSFGPRPGAGDRRAGAAPFSTSVHHDSEPRRRPRYRQWVGDRTLPAGYASEDGVGLVYRGTELVEAVADRPGVSGWHVERTPGQPADGTEVTETRIVPRRLR